MKPGTQSNTLANKPRRYKQISKVRNPKNIQKQGKKTQETDSIQDAKTNSTEQRIDRHNIEEGGNK